MPHIKLQDITKTYTTGETQQTVLDHVSCSIDQGEMVAIVGPSGSGKSTLMNIMGLLDTSYQGDYWLNDQRTSTLHDRALAAYRNQHIGFIFQQFNLLPRLNALQNVALPLHYQNITPDDMEQRAKHHLDQVDMLAFATRKPSELSGGQQQRIAIARALITEPSLILADEPTGSLDSRTRVEILSLFIKIHQTGRTLVLITHDETIAAQCTRKIAINDGKLSSEVSS